jgi:hypothetical protein
MLGVFGKVLPAGEVHFGSPAEPSATAGPTERPANPATAADQTRPDSGWENPDSGWENPDSRGFAQVSPISGTGGPRMSSASMMR